MYLIINNHVVDFKKEKNRKNKARSFVDRKVLSDQRQQRRYYRLEYLHSLENTDVMGENFSAHIFLSVQSRKTSLP